MIATVGALDTVLTVSAAYNLGVLLAARRFRRQASPEASGVLPSLGVSILVPLDGAEPGLEANLAAYCTLDYPGRVQIVVGSLDADDPALVVAKHVARRYPDADLSICAGAAVLGPNRKASLLAVMSEGARHPVIVAVDSDVRVAPDYLVRLVPTLLDPGVGLVSCVYRAPHPRGFSALYEALCINADFSPSVMLAHEIGRRDLAFGASLMLRRSTLDRVGGFAALVDYLADDHRLAELVIADGKRVAVAPYVVESDPGSTSLRGAFRHQLRWARTVRACAPWGHAANILTHGSSFALCTLVLAAMLPLGNLALVLAAGVLLLRFVAAAAAALALGARLSWTLLLVPLRDVAATAIWAASYAFNDVEWRGRRYRVGRGGRMVALAPAGLARAAVRARAATPERHEPGERPHDLPNAAHHAEREAFARVETEKGEDQDLPALLRA